MFKNHSKIKLNIIETFFIEEYFRISKMYRPGAHMGVVLIAQNIY